MHRVFVVEDEPLIRLTIIDALEDARFDVVEASNADEAVRVFDGQTIHFLFTDIQMPSHLSEVDLAQAVAERLRRRDAGMPERCSRSDRQRARSVQWYDRTLVGTHWTWDG